MFSFPIVQRSSSVPSGESGQEPESAPESGAVPALANLVHSASATGARSEVQDTERNSKHLSTRSVSATSASARTVELPPEWSLTPGTPVGTSIFCHHAGGHRDTILPDGLVWSGNLNSAQRYAFALRTTTDLSIGSCTASSPEAS